MSTSDKPKRHRDELTLTLDGALISPEAFKKAAQAFADLLIQVTDEIAHGDVKPLWNISVRPGSSVFVARPVTTADPQARKRAMRTIHAVRSGLSRLTRGSVQIPHFNLQALSAARDLSNLRAKPGVAGITKIQMGNGVGKAVEVTPKVADVVKRSAAGEHRAFGSIEGKLQTISARGGFQFVVFDALTDKGVNCFVPENKFNLAHDAFGKRVRVEGEINYDKQGRPLSINVAGIRVFRELKDLPPIESFLGILESV